MCARTRGIVCHAGRGASTHSVRGDVGVVHRRAGEGVVGGEPHGRGARRGVWDGFGADGCETTSASGGGDGCRGAGESAGQTWFRSEEHTSELQSLMRTSYAVFCLTKKKQGIEK